MTIWQLCHRFLQSQGKARGSKKISAAPISGRGPANCISTRHVGFGCYAQGGFPRWFVRFTPYCGGPPGYERPRAVFRKFSSEPTLCVSPCLTRTNLNPHVAHVPHAVRRFATVLLQSEITHGCTPYISVHRAWQELWARHFGLASGLSPAPRPRQPDSSRCGSRTAAGTRARCHPGDRSLPLPTISGWTAATLLPRGGVTVSSRYAAQIGESQR